MPAYTTVSVDPERAQGLKNFRDEHELPSMDAALEELLRRAPNNSELVDV
jgi:hypothetical protein